MPTLLVVGAGLFGSQAAAYARHKGIETLVFDAGLDRAVAQHAQAGGAVLGICGGLQMLGEALIDTHGIDGNAPGLGLLPTAVQGY